MSQIQVVSYQTKDAKVPFNGWLERVKDGVVKSRILARIRRMSSGLLGDCKSVGEGVLEARLDFGPGYRLYFGLTENNQLIVLLCGGQKSSQTSDIETAKAYWKDYKERT